MGLTISSPATHDGAQRLVLSGDIDLATVSALREALTRAVKADTVTAVDVDLTQVDFLDSTGIVALVEGRRLADGAGKGYRVAGAHGMVRHVLEITGVLDYLGGGPASGGTVKRS